MRVESTRHRLVGKQARPETDPFQNLISALRFTTLKVLFRDQLSVSTSWPVTLLVLTPVGVTRRPAAAGWQGQAPVDAVAHGARWGRISVELAARGLLAAQGFGLLHGGGGHWIS